MLSCCDPTRCGRYATSDTGISAPLLTLDGVPTSSHSSIKPSLRPLLPRPWPAESLANAAGRLAASSVDGCRPMEAARRLSRDVSW